MVIDLDPKVLSKVAVHLAELGNCLVKPGSLHRRALPGEFS